MYITGDALKKHVADRYIDTRLHTVYFSEEAATFPLWDLTGRFLGYQKYNPNASKDKRNTETGRYHLITTTNTNAVWGSESWYLSNTLFVTEGIFDAARLTFKGYSAIAVFSCGLPDNTVNWLRNLSRIRPVVMVADNDKPGIAFTTYGLPYHIVQEYKDLGEASDAYVNSLVKDYT